MQRDERKMNGKQPKADKPERDWMDRLDDLLVREHEGESRKAYMTEEEMDAWIGKYVKPDGDDGGNDTMKDRERELDEMSKRLTARLSAQLGFSLEEDCTNAGAGQPKKEADEEKIDPRPDKESPGRKLQPAVPAVKDPEERIPRIAATSLAENDITIDGHNSMVWAQLMKWAGGVAAAIIFGIVGFQWLEDYRETERRMASAGMSALCREDSTFHLSDGTEIMLQGGTELSARTDFGKDDRHVRINGQGFMHAATDSLRPYIVDMPHDVSLEVKGTAFNINAYSDNPVCEITVSSGCVEIKKTSTGRSYGLFRKGDRFTYNSETGEIIRGKADLSHLLAWRDKDFSLHRATVEEFRQEMFRVYGKTVYIEKGTFKPGASIECRMEYVEHPSLETVLTQVCASQRAGYRIDGSRVFIYPANNI